MRLIRLACLSMLVLLSSAGAGAQELPTDETAPLVLVRIIPIYLAVPARADRGAELWVYETRD